MKTDATFICERTDNKDAEIHIVFVQLDGRSGARFGVIVIMHQDQILYYLPTFESFDAEESKMVVSRVQSMAQANQIDMGYCSYTNWMMIDDPQGSDPLWPVYCNFFISDPDEEEKLLEPLKTEIERMYPEKCKTWENARAQWIEF